MKFFSATILCLSLFLLFVFSCKPKGAHNPYIDAKVKVSEREMKKSKKHLKKGNKAYKKQMRKNRKFLFGRSKAPKA
jgi:hypothetical protein